MSSKIRKFFGIIFKLAFVLLIIAGILTFMMSTFSGNNDSLRLGAEDFLSQTTKTRAVITTLEDLGFVPNVKLHIKDVIFQRQGDPTDILMTLDSMSFSMPLKNYFLPRKAIETLELRELDIRAGYITPKNINISGIRIIEDSTSPKIQLKGKYNGQDVLASLSLIQKETKEGKKLYFFDKETSFELILKDVTISGVMKINPKRTLISDVRLKIGQDQLFEADLEYKFSKKSIPVLSGTLMDGEETVLIEMIAKAGTEYEVLFSGHHSGLSDNFQKKLNTLEKALSFVLSEDGAIRLDFSGVTLDKDMKTNNKVTSDKGNK